jgi:hypothetical protein
MFIISFDGEKGSNNLKNSLNPINQLIHLKDVLNLSITLFFICFRIIYNKNCNLKVHLDFLRHHKDDGIND